MDYLAEPSTIEGITPGAVLQTHGRGTVTVEFKAKNKIYSTTLRDVKHAPEAPNNLISIGRLTDNGHLALFTATGVQFKSGTRVIFGEGQKVGHMYQMRVWTKTLGRTKDFAVVAKGCSWDKWHRILGHVNMWTVKTFLKNSLVTGLLIDESQEPTQCSACIQGKRHVEPFSKEATESADKIGDLILSDVWGPA